jgi:hypothetical protein
VGGTSERWEIRHWSRRANCLFFSSAPAQGLIRPPNKVLSMILVPILAMALGAVAIAVGCLSLLKHRGSPAWARSAVFLGLAAVGMGIWTSHLTK